MSSSEQKYSESTLIEALSLIQDKGWKLSAASKSLGIPYTTLRDKLTGRRPFFARSKFLLTKEEEERLVMWIRMSAERCMGRTYEDIRNKVKEILELRGATSKREDGRPGKDWMLSFMRRHPGISFRRIQACASLSADVVNEWFAAVKAHLDEEDPELLKSADRIYYAEEMGFVLAPSTGKVMAPKKMSHINKLTNNTEHQITVLGCASALGEYLPPMIVYPRKKMPAATILGDFEDAFFQISQNGRMNSAVFKTWLKDNFAVNVATKRKPVVLFIDGLTSDNIDIEALEFCTQEGIILYGLLAHSSHAKQPLDLTVFGSLKSKWPDVVKRNTETTGDTAIQTNFARLFKVAWDYCARPETVIHGFIRSGIFPFNPLMALDSGKLDLEASKSFVITSDSGTNSGSSLPMSDSVNSTGTVEPPTSATNMDDIKTDALLTSHQTEASTSSCTATSTRHAKFSAISELIKVSHWIGMAKSLKFTDMIRDGEASDDPEFINIKNLLDSLGVTEQHPEPPTKKRKCLSTPIPQFSEAL